MLSLFYNSDRLKLTIIILLSLATLLSCSRKKQTGPQSMVVKISAAQDNPSNTQPNITVVYHSADGGISWVPFDNGIPGDATVSAFLVTNDRIFATTDYHGIYAIRDDESEWKRIDQNLPEGIDINAVADINGVLIIGTLRHGIMISRDRGKSWSYAVTEINCAIRCLYVKENVTLAGADDGVYRSFDNGNTWEHAWDAVQVNGFAAINNEIYAALMNGAAASGDTGKSWKYIYKPHTLHDIAVAGQSIYAMTLGDGLKKSENAGHTWANANTGLGTKNLYTFEVKASGNKLFAAQWYGIHTSNNGGLDWVLITNGLPDSTAFTTLETTENGLIAGIGLRKR